MQVIHPILLLTFIFSASTTFEAQSSRNSGLGSSGWRLKFKAFDELIWVLDWLTVVKCFWEGLQFKLSFFYLLLIGNRRVLKKLKRKHLQTMSNESFKKRQHYVPKTILFHLQKSPTHSLKKGNTVCVNFRQNLEFPELPMHTSFVTKLRIPDPHKVKLLDVDH